MSLHQERSRKLKSLKKVFISWSGANSKELANGLKKLLEKEVFENTELECFVSDLDIVSGTDWWQKIQKELKTCKLGILCITKENLRAPWLFFEAGAMVAREVPTIPLLVSCNKSTLLGTPINGSQAIEFYDLKKFLKMLRDINGKLKLGLSDNQVDRLGKEAYVKLKEDLAVVLNDLKELRVFNNKYVYPREVTNIKRNTIFVSVPMSSVDSCEYEDLRTFAQTVKELLLNVGFTDVYCPIIDAPSQNDFDGKTKAIKNNFPIMKHVESLLVIYPRRTVSSILVEMGYGIALSKKMVVFYNEGLPYIMEEAGNTIVNVKTYLFTDYDEILSIIKRNGMTLFEDSLED